MTQETPSWIGIDWSGATPQVWVFGASDQVIAQPMISGTGVAGLADQLSDHLSDTHAAPVICVGLPDLTPTSLRPVPARPLGGLMQLHSDDPRITIHAVPGLAQQKPLDIMQGTQTALAGFMSADPDFDGVVCSVGAQTQWAHISAGEVVSFQSFLTPDLAAFMLGHLSLNDAGLAQSLDATAFATAINDMMARPQNLAASLARLSAQKAVIGTAPATLYSAMIGVLIGVELSGARPYWLGQRVAILGDADLADHYGRALQTQGVETQILSRTNALVTGMALLRHG